MILLGKSRKKYHGSIMKYCRSIIKDSTMHEKRLLKHQEKSVKTSQRAKRILPKNKLTYTDIDRHIYG